MNVQPKLTMKSKYGETEVVVCSGSVAMFQDGDEILLLESEARQLFECLSLAFNGTG